MSAPTAEHQNALDDHGEFTGSREKDVLGVPLCLVEAWSRNDGYGASLRW
ncbi:hypothetical protein [Streptomyces sp. NPDC050388]